MEIQHEDRGDFGGFYVIHEGRRAGELTYSRVGAVTSLDHTYVSEALRGRQAGQQLVEAAVAWARRDGRKLRPLCSFAQAAFARDPSLRDVLG